MTNLYYQPPTDKQFEELKARAIDVWNSYDNTYGYVDEKVNAVKGIKNVKDNGMYIVSMFDFHNQGILSQLLTPETRKAVSDRMIAGGNPPEYNPFLEDTMIIFIGTPRKILTNHPVAAITHPPASQEDEYCSCDKPDLLEIPDLDYPSIKTWFCQQCDKEVKAYEEVTE